MPSAGHPEIHVTFRLPVHAGALFAEWQRQNDIAGRQFSAIGAARKKRGNLQFAYPE